MANTDYHQGLNRLDGRLTTAVIEPARAAWSPQIAAAAKPVADVAPDMLALRTTALRRAFAAYGPLVEASASVRDGAARAIDAAARALETELTASVEGLVAAKAFKNDTEKAAIDVGRDLLDRATIALVAWSGEFHRFDADINSSSGSPTTLSSGPLFLRNATTADPVLDPYMLLPSLTAPAETGYFVLQYALDALSEEELHQLDTDHKLAGQHAIELTEDEEEALLERLDRRLEALANELRRGDEQVFELLAPIPTHGWLIRSSKRLAQIASLEGVRFVDVFHPEFKLTTTLRERVEALAATTTSSDVRVGLRLLLFHGEAVDAVVAAVKRLRGVTRVVDHIGFEDGRQIAMKVVGAVVPEVAIAAVAQLAQVYLIDEDAVPGASLDVAHGRTGVDAARATVGAIFPLPPALDGAGEVIGIYDTGVDNGAAIVADLNGRVVGDTANWLNGPAPVSWADRWYDGIGPPATAGHGTKVTGIAIGNGAMSGGAIVGVAPGANAVIRPWSADFQAGWPAVPMTFDINQALNNAHAQGARIHNNSWGETQGPDLDNLTFFWDQYRHSDLQIDAFTNATPEMLVVTSAGNQGDMGANTITSPGTGKNVLTVGSSGNGDPASGNVGVDGVGIQLIAPGSSRGPAPFNRLKPDIVTPGEQIAAIRAQALPAAGGGAAPDYQAHPAYTYSGGTSFAAPYVSGVAALIRQFLGDNAFHAGNAAIGQRPAPSGMLIKAMIINGAGRINPGGNHIPNNNEGWGLINLNRSIDPAGLLLVYDSIDPNDPLNGGNPFRLRRRGTTRRDFAINVIAGQPLSITLAFYDRWDGGAVGALVYDLDLVMRHNATGDLYRGGVPGFLNGESRQLHTGVDKRNAAFRDHSNTVEKLYIAAPVAGAYSVRVKRRHIPYTGPFHPAERVPFALVIHQA